MSVDFDLPQGPPPGIGYTEEQLFELQRIYNALRTTESILGASSAASWNYISSGEPTIACYKIATLPADSMESYDFVHFRAVVGGAAGWTTAKTIIDIVMQNAGGFRYKSIQLGDSNSTAGVQAYTQVDGTTDVYIVLGGNNDNVISVSVLAAQQIVTYPTPNLLSAVPPGTVVYASNVPNTYIPDLLITEAGTFNATTATRLQTARNINGVPFDGTADITIAAGGGGGSGAVLTFGAFLTGGSYNGSAAATVAVDATSANTANKVVVRDASGNFAAGQVTVSDLIAAAATLNGLATRIVSAAMSTVEVGYMGTPQNIQNANYTFVATDRGKDIFHSSATAHTYTIPANAAVAFPIGTTIIITNTNGAGNLTIAITTDTLRRGDGTAGTGSRTVPANAVASVRKIAATQWIITGVFT